MGGAHGALELASVGGRAGSPLHRLDPRAKLLGLTAVTVVAVATPVDRWPVYLACATVLAACVAIAGIGPAELWRRTRVVLPLVLLLGVFAPFVREGGATWDVGPLTVHQAGLEVAAAACCKAAIGCLAAVVLAATTGFPAVLRALRSLRVPRLLVTIAGLMYRYMFVLAAETNRTMSALRSRAYRPRTPLDAVPLGRAATALFLRSHARAERVHGAMLARGFDGELPEGEALSLGARDVAFAAAVALPPALLAIGLAVGA